MNDTALPLSQAHHTPVAILGVPFDPVTASGAIAEIEDMIASRRPHYLVTANVDFLVQARADVELRRILIDAHLVLCDGTPVQWASRFLGNPLPERVAGADLVPKLIRVAAGKKYRLFFLGASPAACEKAVERLRREHPDLIIAGYYSPPFHTLLEMDHEEIRRRITEAQPDLLFVSFGCPKAEKWIAMNYRAMGVPVAVGVGATIDFLAGNVKRAPRWMQKSGTEWLFRLAQEPRRLFRRYANDLFVFGWAMLAQWWQLRRLGWHAARATAGLTGVTRSAPSDAVHTPEGAVLIKAPERLDATAVHDAARFEEFAHGIGERCLLDMSGVRVLDSTGIGLLIWLQKEIHARQGQMVLVAPNHAVRRALALLNLEDYFAAAPNLASAEKLIETRLREQSMAVTSASPAAPLSLAWQGEITAANAELVWRRTEESLTAQRRPRSVEIDLSQARFIDSTGLSIMVRTQRLARRCGTNLQFTGVQPSVRNVLRVSQLEQLLLEKPELFSMIADSFCASGH